MSALASHCLFLNSLEVPIEFHIISVSFGKNFLNLNSEGSVIRYFFKSGNLADNRLSIELTLYAKLFFSLKQISQPIFMISQFSLRVGVSGGFCYHK